METARPVQVTLQEFQGQNAVKAEHLNTTDGHSRMQRAHGAQQCNSKSKRKLPSKNRTCHPQGGTAGVFNIRADEEQGLRRETKPAKRKKVLNSTKANRIQVSIEVNVTKLAKQFVEKGIVRVRRVMPFEPVRWHMERKN